MWRQCGWCGTEPPTSARCAFAGRGVPASLKFILEPFAPMRFPRCTIVAYTSCAVTVCRATRTAAMTCRANTGLRLRAVQDQGRRSRRARAERPAPGQAPAARHPRQPRRRQRGRRRRRRRRAGGRPRPRRPWRRGPGRPRCGPRRTRRACVRPVDVAGHPDEGQGPGGAGQGAQGR